MTKSRHICMFLFLIFFSSCKTSKTVAIPSDVNTKLNAEYQKSKKAFTGKLSSSEYLELKKQIEKELNTDIPDGKSILVNYHQKGPNCISMRFKKQYIERGVKSSQNICSNNNTLGFFVFAKNTLNKALYLRYPIFKLDSGFFYDNVFTLHENCSAFLIIKANRNFLKYYGEDYSDEIRGFLEKNN